MSLRRLRKDNIGVMAAKVATCVLLIFTLVFTSGLLYSSVANKDDNSFATGEVSINFNDGMAVFGDDDIEIIPDRAIEKNFFIRNQSSCGVHYRLYIENLRGAFANRLVAIIVEKNTEEGDREVYRAQMGEFLKENVAQPFGELLVGETKDFIFKIYCPREAEQVGEIYVEFDIRAEAVQIGGHFD